MPVQDNETKAGIFPGKVIIVDHGKIVCLSPSANFTLKDSDYTQWIAIKDLKNLVFYFRNYENLMLRTIDLKKLDMKPGAPKKAMIAAFIGLDNSHFWRIAQDTTAINRFHLVEDGRKVGKTWYITSINETGHLRGMMRGVFVDF
jgi:hypothetical protein